MPNPYVLLGVVALATAAFFSAWEAGAQHERSHWAAQQAANEQLARDTEAERNREHAIRVERNDAIDTESKAAVAAQLAARDVALADAQRRLRDATAAARAASVVPTPTPTPGGCNAPAPSAIDVVARYGELAERRAADEQDKFNDLRATTDACQRYIREVVFAAQPLK